MLEIGEVRRNCGFESLPQADRDIGSYAALADLLLADIETFELAWTSGTDLQVLGARFRFQKVHDADCARRGILIYEIYIERGKYRAVVAWFQESGPGYWVAVFKKQGNPQSKASLKTAGERAVRRWRQEHA